MGAKKRAAKAGATAAAVKENPYLQKLIEDEKLRQDIWNVFESARAAVDRLDGQSPVALLEDKKLKKEIATAAESARSAAKSLKEAPAKKRRVGPGRLILLLLVGGIVALVASEDLRNKVLDVLFGAEEEFEYTSPTTAPTAAPAGAAS